MFGANATGKTTIGRVIEDAARFEDCGVTWKNGTRLQTMVYNRDFVDRNFNQSTELKGVFTLGENQLETLAKIQTKKIKLNDLTKKKASLMKNLEGQNRIEGKRAELTALENDFAEICWEQKKKHDNKFKVAFSGYRNNSAKFKEKVLHESTTNDSALLLLNELEQKAESVFEGTQVTEPFIPTLNADNLLLLESNSILRKKVIGQKDVDIAAMIRKLENSDWVRQGKPFFEANNGYCPFCQQITDEKFTQSLNEYFDKTFELDTREIEALATNYQMEREQLQHQVASIVESSSKFLGLEKVNTEKELLESIININLQKILIKKKEPSRAIELESIRNVIDSIDSLVDSANVSIRKHNEIAANLAAEQSRLTNEVWRYVLDEVSSNIASYKRHRNNLNKAIDSLTEQIDVCNVQIRNTEVEIAQLEQQSTSIQPTIDGINSILSSFGFRAFSIKKASNGTSYRLARVDDSDAQETLSEGEQSFVAFLYFYHLLKGSASESGITNDRVVVFDDPVSSLDSDILFIVGSLIKELFNDLREEQGYIKQIFVFTHNVYFHKEVTFNPNRREKALKEETFWIVRKSDGVSKIEQFDENPIKTAYELLWSEVRNPDRSHMTIQNSLRRILEYYFQIIGGWNPDEIIGMFEGSDKMICRSLFAWVHVGSHAPQEDLYVSNDSSAVEVYLRVFREIFCKLGHFAHYKMMMGGAKLR